jgi:nitrile hydratase beta subunit
MDGIHDLGGMEGFGPVAVERDEPVFHAPWEGRVVGLLFALGPLGIRVGMYRHAVERMNPAHYLAASYYERMLTGVTTLLVEGGVVERTALEARAGGRVPLAQPVAADVVPVAATPGPTPRFAPGDAVVVRDVHPRGHTRCPRYGRGRRGVVVRVDPAFRVADVEAHAPDPPREPTYGVRFAARTLWGDAADPHAAVHVDLWERHLEHA